MLEGVNVALGVTGSIAAVRTVELAHELRRRGASVRAVQSEAARGIVHPWALEFATGAEPVTELTGAVEHVELCGREGWADVLLVAPATANTLAKVAATIDDTPVTTCATTALGADVPVVVAPAMHEPMYDHPGIPEVVGRLEDWGVTFVDPRIEEGKAKIATDDAIALATARAARSGAGAGDAADAGGDDSAGNDDRGRADLAGESIVVTAGATAEPIDPVRVLTNRSSGKMGRAVARACYVRGADVTLVHGPVGPQSLSSTAPDARSDDPAVPYADLVEVEDSASMLDALEAALPAADALVAAAAVGDYTTSEHADKLRSGQELSLDLEPTPKLIDGAREARPDVPIVGFKTETSGDDEAMVTAAREIAARADLDLVVANDASVMGETETRALFVDGAERDAAEDDAGSDDANGDAESGDADGDAESDDANGDAESEATGSDAESGDADGDAESDETTADDAPDGDAAYEVVEGTKAHVGDVVAARLAGLLARDGGATADDGSP